MTPGLTFWRCQSGCEYNVVVPCTGNGNDGNPRPDVLSTSSSSAPASSEREAESSSAVSVGHVVHADSSLSVSAPQGFFPGISVPTVLFAVDVDDAQETSREVLPGPRDAHDFANPRGIHKTVIKSKLRRHGGVMIAMYGCVVIA